MGAGYKTVFKTSSFFHLSLAKFFCQGFKILKKQSRCWEIQEDGGEGGTTRKTRVGWGWGVEVVSGGGIKEERGRGEIQKRWENPET